LLHPDIQREVELAKKTQAERVAAALRKESNGFFSHHNDFWWEFAQNAGSLLVNWDANGEAMYSDLIKYSNMDDGWVVSLARYYSEKRNWLCEHRDVVRFDEAYEALKSHGRWLMGLIKIYKMENVDGLVYMEASIRVKDHFPPHLQD